MILKLKNVNFIIVKIFFCEKIYIPKKYRYLTYLKLYFFIGYKDDDHKTKLLRIMLPKTSAYVKSYERGTKWMHLLIKDDELLET